LKTGPDEKRRAALREIRFERRLGLALPGADNEPLRRELGYWYELRSYPAHGESLGTGYNIAVVFERAFELDELVNAQIGQAGGQEPTE
jgi:hypothetical protein